MQLILLLTLKVCNYNPIINIRPASSETLVDDLRLVQKYSDAALARQGIKGKQLQLLIVILPDANNIYSMHQLE